jgi:hypothetical protein
MVYKVEDIVRDVRVALDENKTAVQLIVDNDSDTLSLDEIIRSKILEAVQRVELEAPYYLLEDGHNFGDAIYWSDLCSGWVLLPKDFMRLVVFEMSDWERAVYGAFSASDPIYAKQRSRTKGVRGTAQRPVCILAFRPEGKALEFYSCKSEDAKVSKAVYIPYPEEDENGGIDISERCYTAVVYMTAGLSLATCNEADKATTMFNLAHELLK